jgi:hypothetical protein
VVKLSVSFIERSQVYKMSITTISVYVQLESVKNLLDTGAFTILLFTSLNGRDKNMLIEKHNRGNF